MKSIYAANTQSKVSVNYSGQYQMRRLTIKLSNAIEEMPAAAWPPIEVGVNYSGQYQMRRLTFKLRNVSTELPAAAWPPIENKC